MEIIIRQAKESEINVLIEFEQGIVEAERPFDNTLKLGEIHYYDLLELIKSRRLKFLLQLLTIKLSDQDMRDYWMQNLIKNMKSMLTSDLCLLNPNIEVRVSTK
jgi:hypothetical protein